MALLAPREKVRQASPTDDVRREPAGRDELAEGCSATSGVTFPEVDSPST